MLCRKMHAYRDNGTKTASRVKSRQDSWACLNWPLKGSITDTKVKYETFWVEKLHNACPSADVTFAASLFHMHLIPGCEQALLTDYKIFILMDLNQAACETLRGSAHPCQAFKSLYSESLTAPFLLVTKCKKP